MKKKPPYFVAIFLIVLCVLFIILIWNVFLENYIPHHRTIYFSYANFIKDKKNYDLPESLPPSARRIKLYSGVRRFVSCAGYSMYLSESEYDDFLDVATERYRKKINPKVKDEEIYISEDFSELLDENIILCNDIGEIKELIAKDEVVQDYNIIAMYSYYGGPINYFSIIVADSKNYHISELSVIDRRIR